LFIIFIIAHAVIDKNTQVREYIIQLLAFFTFSSSPPDIKYKIPLPIRAITAITATYCINSDIKLHHTFVTTLPVHILSHGNQCPLRPRSGVAFEI